jgi:hypothetical protein
MHAQSRALLAWLTQVECTPQRNATTREELRVSRSSLVLDREERKFEQEAVQISLFYLLLGRFNDQRFRNGC